MQRSTWLEGEDRDVYEVESRVPLPRPFPLCSTLTSKNAVVIQTQISHVSHRANGHLLKVVSKISLPTPPYTVGSAPDPGSGPGLQIHADAQPCNAAGGHVGHVSVFMAGSCYRLPPPLRPLNQPAGRL